MKLQTKRKVSSMEQESENIEKNSMECSSEIEYVMADDSLRVIEFPYEINQSSTKTFMNEIEENILQTNKLVITITSVGGSLIYACLIRDYLKHLVADKGITLKVVVEFAYSGAAIITSALVELEKFGYDVEVNGYDSGTIMIHVPSFDKPSRKKKANEISICETEVMNSSDDNLDEINLAYGFIFTEALKESFPEHYEKYSEGFDVFMTFKLFKDLIINFDDSQIDILPIGASMILN